MKISFKDYNYIMNNLQNIQIVSDDKSTTDNAHNIYFCVNKADNSLKLSAWNKNTTYRIKCSNMKYNMDIEEDDERFFEDDKLIFAVNSKEVVSFLNSYRTLSTTYVEEITFSAVFNEKGLGKITCIVSEAESKEEDEEETYGVAFADEEPETKRSFRSQWVFDLVQVSKVAKANIYIDFDFDNFETIDNQPFKLITYTLLPLLVNDTSTFSYINFTKPTEKIKSPLCVVFTNTHTAIIGNPLGSEIFTNLRLSYRHANFIDKVVICDDAENGSFKVQKYENNLKLVWGSNDEYEAILGYDTKIGDFEKHIAAKSRDRSVSINRLYFKDIVKRLCLVNDIAELKFDFSNNILTMENSKFQQEVPLVSVENLTADDNFSIRMMPTIFDKVIMGKDNDVNQEDVFSIFINLSNSVLCFTSPSNSWQTIAITKLIKSK